MMGRRNVARQAGLLMVLMGGAFGCGSGGTGSEVDAGGGLDADTAMVDAALPDAAPPDAAPAVDPAGTHHQYVANMIDIPTTGVEADALGLDIDGDPMMRPDNALGKLIAVLLSFGGGDPQVVVDGLVADGVILHLMDLQTTSLDDATGVGFAIFIGDDGDVPPDPTDNFSGTETFVVQPGTPIDGLLTGDIVAGVLHAGPGVAYVQITIIDVSPPFIIKLVGARIEADVTATGMAGLLGGAVTSEDVDSVILPEVHAVISDVIASDCFAGTCAPGSDGELLLNLFDADDDGMVSLDELRDNDLIRSLVAPDLDLFDADGDFNPRVDGVNDSLSFGFGFTGVGAVFDRP